MAKVDHIWSAERPPKADVYVTRRNESKITTVRWWDGGVWWDVAAWRGVRRGTDGHVSYDHPHPFKWPKSPRVPRPAWMRSYNRNRIGLRSIGNQSVIQWGTPFKVFDEKEVLAHLVAKGILPKDWKTVYQSDMRGDIPIRDVKYLLQDTRSYVGNCPMFWKESGGYTTNIDEARRFTFEKAMAQFHMREGVDMPWRENEITALRRPTMDMQYFPRSQKDQAEFLVKIEKVNL